MRLLVLSLLFLFPTSVLASWNYWASVYELSRADANTSAASKMASERPGDPYYLEFQDRNSDYKRYMIYVWTGTEPFTLPPIDEVVFSGTYTDEQCQSALGSRQVFEVSLSSVESFTSSGGACQVTLNNSATCWESTDDEGNPASYCAVQGADDFTITSTGQAASPDEEQGSAVDESTFDPPDYMTPVDANDGICSSGSCITIDGQTYHVDQSAIDDGSVNIIDLDGSGDGSDTGGGDTGGDEVDPSDDAPDGIDWGEESSDGATDGTSTDADGNPLGAGDGDPDGDGEGDSTLGDIVKTLGGIKTVIRNGFDGIWDKMDEGQDELIDEIDPDAVVEGSSIHSEYEELDAAQEEYSTDVMGKFDELGSDDSSPIAGPIVDHLPALPSASCSPLVFGVAPMQITVPCSVFEMFRTWFAWIIYAWSALTIIDTFFASSTKRA